MSIVDARTSPSATSLVHEQLRALSALMDLKEVARAGWSEHQVPPLEVESVADHSYGMALLALTLPLPPAVDRNSLVALCLLHDLPEAITGDFTPTTAPVAKHQLERAAVETQFAALRHAGILDPSTKGFVTLLGRDDRTDPTVAWVHYLDRFELLLQAARYVSTGRGVGMRDFARTPHGLEGTALAAMADALVEVIRAEARTPSLP